MPILALITEYQNVAEEQVVVLFQILAAEINFGYRFQTVQCMSFNGTKIQNLKHMATMVDSCPCGPLMIQTLLRALHGAHACGPMMCTSAASHQCTALTAACCM